MAAGYPSSSNTYVPSHEASGSLVIGYSRNPKKFKINDYCKIIPVTQDIGKYLNITAESAARVINNPNDYIWHDGQEAPTGNWETESFEFLEYRTLRRTYPFSLGHKSVNQASWDILAVHAGFAAQKAMTARTMDMATALTTGGNWSGSTDTATALAGGKWDVSGASDKFILKTFDAVAQAILKATLGVVSREDLVCVISPNVAVQIAQSEEIRDFIKQSPVSWEQAQFAANNQNRSWGLPETLYGIKIIVEDAVKVTSTKGATKATDYCFPSTAAVFLARPGGIMGMEGIAEFSTAVYFMYEEMTVETMDDPNNRRTVGRVVEDFQAKVIAPASGFYVSAVVD